jgi:hypothetical protein
MGSNGGKREKLRDSEANLTIRMQMRGARRGCEIGIDSLFLCLDVE